MSPLKGELWNAMAQSRDLHPWSGTAGREQGTELPSPCAAAQVCSVPGEAQRESPQPSTAGPMGWTRTLALCCPGSCGQEAAGDQRWADTGPGAQQHLQPT